MPLGDIVEHKVSCYCHGQLGLNVFHWRITTETGGRMSNQALADNLAADFADQYKAILSAAARYMGASAKNLTDGPLLASGISANGAGDGTRGATPLPTQVCGITSWKSLFAGPRGRGRTYWPFPSTDDVDVTERPNDAYLADIVTLATSLITNYTATAGGQSTVLERVLDRVHVSIPTLVMVQQTRPRWATQKRRGDYGRTNPMQIQA